MTLLGLYACLIMGQGDKAIVVQPMWGWPLNDSFLGRLFFMAHTKSQEEYLKNLKESYKDVKGVTVDSVTGAVSIDSVATGSFNAASANVALDVTLAGGSKLTEVTTGSGNDSLTVNGNANGLSIDLGSGNNTLAITGTATNFNVNLNGGGDDVVTIDKGVVDSKIDASGEGNKTIEINGVLDPSYVLFGAGNDSIKVHDRVIDSTIEGGAGNDSIVIDSVLSGSTVVAGDGDDVISVKAGIKDSTVYGGAGKDSVTVLGGGDTSVIDLGADNDFISLDGSFTDVTVVGGEGKDSFSVGKATGVYISDYDVNEDVIISATGTGATSLSADGVISVGSGATVSVNKINGYYAANVDGKKTFWGSEDGGLVDASSETKPVVLDGRVNVDVVDTLLGGKKDDTLYAGEGDYVYGAEGKDSIVLNSASNTTRELVGLSADGGKDTVENFKQASNTVDAEDADVVYLFQNNISDMSIATATGGTEVKVGKASLTLNNVTATSDAKINVMDSSQTVSEVDFVVGTANVSDELSDVYYAGSKTASLNFGNNDNALVVDLDSRNWTDALTNTNKATYVGKFATVTGGKDNTVLMGAADVKETLVAGSGDTTLWGGGSKADQLTHSTGSNTVMFYFDAGDGKDSITSNNWGSDDSDDVLWFGNDAHVASIKNNGSKTTITLTNSDDKLTLNVTNANDVVKFTTDGGKTIQKAKIGKANTANTFTYDSDVNMYLGGKKNTLTVGSGVDSAKIWLNGSTGKYYENVTEVNASSSTGDLELVGDYASDKLTAGRGNTTLWGGAGNVNDTMVSSSGGTTTFYFGKGEGNDVITRSGSNDKVVLYNVALSDIVNADATSTAGSLKLTMNDGSSLTVQNVSTSSVNTFQLADGSQWTYDAKTKNWSSPNK